LSTSLSVTNAMTNLVLCRFRAGRGAKSLIRRGCAGVVSEKYN
jgi:hypothetical protein